MPLRPRAYRRRGIGGHALGKAGNCHGYAQSGPRLRPGRRRHLAEKNRPGRAESPDSDDSPEISLHRRPRTSRASLVLLPAQVRAHRLSITGFYPDLVRTKVNRVLASVELIENERPLRAGRLDAGRKRFPAIFIDRHLASGQRRAQRTALRPKHCDDNLGAVPTGERLHLAYRMTRRAAVAPERRQSVQGGNWLGARCPRPRRRRSPSGPAPR